MKKVKNLDRLELAIIISEHLKKENIDVVLTGGSCVSIYSSEKYVSMDLDFIDISLQSTRKISKALEKLGFTKIHQNSRHFAHPENNLTVEFPSGPLMVGDEAISANSLGSIATDLGELRLLTPTDCVKDRLANFYYFKDKQCFEQALMVARAHPVNLGSLRKWHHNEHLEEEYKQFISLLK